MTDAFAPFAQDEQGYSVVPPSVPGWERLRAALAAGPDEPLRWRTRTDDRNWATGEVADLENLFSPGVGLQLRSAARSLDVPVPDAMLTDVEADLWGYVLDEAERRARARFG